MPFLFFPGKKSLLFSVLVLAVLYELERVTLVIPEITLVGLSQKGISFTHSLSHSRSVEFESVKEGGGGGLDCLVPG